MALAEVEWPQLSLESWERILLGLAGILFPGSADMTVYHFSPSDSSVGTGGPFEPVFAQGSMLLLLVTARHLF